MKWMYKKILYCFLLLLGIVSLLDLKAQNNTMYYMTTVPQVYFLNPAVQPACKSFIGVPLASIIGLNVSNNAVTFNDIFYEDLLDSVFQFNQTTEYTDKFLSKLDELNVLAEDVKLNILSFGFRANRMYFTFDLTTCLESRQLVPKDLARLSTYHLPDGSTFDLSSFNLDLQSYLEIGVGISRTFGDQLSVGIRPKILFGLASISSNTREFTLASEGTTKDLTATINTEINISVPGIIMPEDSNGVLDFSGDYELDTANLVTWQDYVNLATGNKGFGIDIGLKYNPFERLELSASIIDLGYIKWKSYSHSYSAQGSYVFDGFVFNSTDSSLAGQDILDSLDARFDFQGTEKDYTTNLSPKLFIGARYFLTPSFDLGVLARFNFYRDAIKSDFLLAGNWRPLSFWSVSASYGLIDGSYSTFGLGMSFRVGTFNLYLASDDIPSTYTMITNGSSRYPMPNDMISVNLRVGVNHVFGAGKKKQMRKDKPMYFPDEY